MRFAVVGCGYISRVHLAALQQIEGAEAVAVVDVNEEAARKRAEEYGIPNVYTDWNKAFKRQDVDAALICLPHKFHYRCTIDALNAGKHVLVEKVISVTMEEAREMTAVAKKEGLTLMVAHMKRFDRRFEVMKEKIDQGCIGKVFLAKSEWIGPKEVFTINPWLANKDHGGGPLSGFGSHHIDLLHWMVGLPSKVSCYTNHLVWPKIEVEDTAVVILTFENGAIGSLIYTFGATIHGQYENITIHGTDGTLNLVNEDLTLTSEKINGDRVPKLLNTKRADEQGIETFGKELAIASLDPFKREIRHFLDCVEKKLTPITDGKVAGDALNTIIKAYQSAQGGVAMSFRE